MSRNARCILLGLAYTSLERAVPLDVGFSQRSSEAQTWREMQVFTEGEQQLNLLRRRTYTGRLLGDEEFITTLENRFQRNWRHWSFEKAAPAG